MKKRYIVEMNTMDDTYSEVYETKGEAIQAAKKFMALQNCSVFKETENSDGSIESDVVAYSSVEIS